MMKKFWPLLLVLLLTSLSYSDITPLPDPPSRTSPSTFAAKADAFLGALPAFATEANQLASDVNDDEVAAAASAAAALGYSNIALSSANFAGDWDDQAGAAAPPYAVWHAGNYWQLVSAVLDVSATEPGQTADWRVIGDKITVSTIADLRLLTGVGTSSAYLVGHSSPEDGGQGVFYWDAASVLADNNGTVILPTGHSGAGRWVRQYEYLTPDMFGGILTAGPEIRLLPKTYTLDEAKTFTDSVYKIAGTLAVNTVAGAATSSASGIDSGTYAISFGSAKTSFGLDLSGFLLSYAGAGIALTVDDFINTNIHELFIDCNGAAPYGVSLTGNSFFSAITNTTISRFTNTGIILNSVGTKAVVRDCDISSSQASAVAAIEVNTAGATIQDGQADVRHATDHSGIGVFFNNESASSALYGGLVEGTLFETGTGIVIDGTTHAFANVVARNTRHTLGTTIAPIVKRGIVFERAYNCVMENPTVYNPTAGTIATWGANSIKCGLVGGFDACRSLISVHGSATQAYKICNEPILYSERANITTSANLTTTVEDCQYLGKTIHNGTAWDKSRDAIADDSFVAITPPKTVGSVKIQTTAGGGEYILANYNTATGVTTALVTGGNCQISGTNGALDGTTGTDGYLTLRSYATDGKIYIENRRGTSRTCVVFFFE